MAHRFVPALVAAAVAASAVVALGTPASAADGVLWDGGLETGGLPYGSLTGGGTADSQYSTVHQAGGAGHSEIVDHPTRTPDSTRALKISMPAHSQREQPVSQHSWYPDAAGTVDEWYGFSIYYDTDWNLGGGIAKEVSGSSWHVPASWRMTGDNGSLNMSGDLVDGKPRMMLRRNTVQNREGFYTDGLGLDKIDAGPVVVGAWMDFVVHIRWSTTSTHALREVWRDGVHMGSSTSRNAVGTAKHVFRIGQYQDTNIAHTRTSYYDNVRIGTSYAAVDPARAAGPVAVPAPTTQPAPSPEPEPEQVQEDTPVHETLPTAGPSFRAATTGAGNAAEANAYTLAAPASTSGGTLLLAGIAFRGSPRVTAPAGWIPVTSRVIKASSTLRIYRYTCPTSGCGARSWTWRTSTSNGISGVLSAYDGVHDVRPVDGVATQGNTASSASTAPSTSTSSDDAMLVTFHSIAGSPTFTAPRGMVERAENRDDTGRYRSAIGVADVARQTAGATEARTATFSSAAANIGAAVVLSPADATAVSAQAQEREELESRLLARVYRRFPWYATRLGVHR